MGRKTEREGQKRRQGRREGGRERKKKQGGGSDGGVEEKCDHSKIVLSKEENGRSFIFGNERRRIMFWEHLHWNYLKCLIKTGIFGY